MKRLSLRIPDDLYDELKKLAEKNTRSMHAEILHLIKEAIRYSEEAEKKQRQG